MEGLRVEPVYANRVTTLLEALSKRLVDGGSIERRELSIQLLTVSKLIDHAVATNQKPKSQLNVLKSLKQFAYFKFDEMLRPSVMVLMFSVKSACLAGWFKESDVADLLELFKVVYDYFMLDGKCWKPPIQSLPGGSISNEMTEPERFVKDICSRYFPRLSLLSLIIALTVKKGYEVHGCDFQVISQLAPYTQLRLFVCQKDDTSTSACLVTPPLVSFLLNGKGVERRMYLATAADAGPQMPSDITTLLRIGCNFLQVVGNSTATYFVAIGIMASVPWLASSAELEEYVIPSPSEEADDEVIIGRSRVSLRCPISHQRIITPTKGVSCRHHQAFDFDSYLEINDRRPSWRCPCCNTYVNCSELRLDRQMEQVLREVDENVFDVMVNLDGSWAPDVSADEADSTHLQGTGQSPGDNVMRRLEGVINVSDNEEEEDGNGLVERLVSPREPFRAQVSSIGTSSIDFVDVEDRKPDIRSILMNEAVVGTDSTQTALPVGVSNRGALESPVLNAIYSPISDPQSQAVPATVTNTRSFQDSHGALRNSTPTSMGNLSSWPPVSSFVYPSSLATGGQSSDNRLLSTDSQIYPQQPSRSTVIQALPAPGHYPNPIDRGRLNPSVQVSNTPVGHAIPSTGSTGLSDRGRMSPSVQVSSFPVGQGVSSTGGVGLSDRGRISPSVQVSSFPIGQGVSSTGGIGLSDRGRIGPSGQVSNFPVGQGTPSTVGVGLSDRGRLNPSMHSSNFPVGQAIPSTVGVGLSPIPSLFEGQTLQQQQIQNSDMADMVMMQEIRQQSYNTARLQHQQMGPGQRNQGLGLRSTRQQHGVVQNGLGNVQTQYVASRGHQNSSHGHHNSSPGHQSSGHGHQSSGHGQQGSSHGHQSSSHGHQSSSHGHQSSSHGHQSSSHGRQNSSHGRQISSHGHQNSNQLGQQQRYPMNASQLGTAVSSRQVQDYWTRQRLSQQLQSAAAGSSAPRGPPSGGVQSGNGTSLSSTPGVPTGGPQHALFSRTGSSSMYPGGTNSVANPTTVTSTSGSDGWIPPSQFTNWRPAGTPRMRGAVGGGSTVGMSAAAGRGGTVPVMSTPGPVNRIRAPQINLVPGTSQVTSNATTTLWGGHSSSGAVDTAGFGDLYNTPESLSTSTLLQDVSWLPTTQLDSPPMDNDPEYWLDDSLFMSNNLFMPSSSSGQ